VSINGRRALKRAYAVPMMLIGERGRRLYPLSPADIEYIQSDGNYVKYASSGAEYVARELMKDLSEWLRPSGFLRIERSLLVNLRAVDYIEPLGHSTFTFTLNSGTSLHSGRTYRAAILKALPLRRRAVGQSDLKGRGRRARGVELVAPQGWSSIDAATAQQSSPHTALPSHFRLTANGD
jgi:hypothetical protein